MDWVVTTVLLSSLGLIQGEKPMTAPEILLKFKEVHKRASDTCRMEDFIEAKALLQQGIKSDSSYLYLFHYYLALADFRLANCSSQNEKKAEEAIKEAIKNLEVSLSLKGDFSDSHALFGSVLGFRISLDPYRGPFLGRKARNSIERAIQLDPENPRAYLAQGVSYYHTPSLFGGGVDKAIKALEKAIKLFEKERKEGTIEPSWGHDEAYGWLGLCYVKKRNRPMAEEAFKKGLALNPDNSWIRYHLNKLKRSS